MFSRVEQNYQAEVEGLKARLEEAAANLLSATTDQLKAQEEANNKCQAEVERLKAQLQQVAGPSGSPGTTAGELYKRLMGGCEQVLWVPASELTEVTAQLNHANSQLKEVGGKHQTEVEGLKAELEEAAANLEWQLSATSDQLKAHEEANNKSQAQVDGLNTQLKKAQTAKLSEANSKCEAEVEQMNRQLKEAPSNYRTDIEGLKAWLQQAAAKLSLDAKIRDESGQVGANAEAELVPPPDALADVMWVLAAELAATQVKLDKANSELANRNEKQLAIGAGAEAETQWKQDAELQLGLLKAAKAAADAEVATMQAELEVATMQAEVATMQLEDIQTELQQGVTSRAFLATVKHEMELTEAELDGAELDDLNCEAEQYSWELDETEADFVPF